MLQVYFSGKMGKFKFFFGLLGIGGFVLFLVLHHKPFRDLIDWRDFGFAVLATFIVFILEIVAVGWQQSSLRKIMRERDRSQRTDLVLFLVRISGTMSVLVIIFSLGSSYLLGQAGQMFVRETTGLNLRIDTGNGLLNFVIYYILYSFLEYWSHRLFHTEPFWHLHRLHYSATSLNPLVMHRAHPANLFLDPLFRTALPIALVAAPGFALFALFIVTTFYQLLVHSNAPWDWGWFGKWVLISPKAHRLHHSAKIEHFGKNLSVLAIWDHLFGTWYNGDVPVEELGLAENYNDHSLIHNCSKDFHFFLMGCKHSLARIWRGIFSPKEALPLAVISEDSVR